MVALVSPAALADLARLLDTPLDVLEPFASPHAGEMIRLVELHLRSHVARFGGFRALHLLSSLEGAAA
jgi:hypothetical protein